MHAMLPGERLLEELGLEVSVYMSFRNTDIMSNSIVLAQWRSASGSYAFQAIGV